jgi:hypothetical protein
MVVPTATIMVQVPVNAETGQVKMGPNHLSGNATYKDLGHA